MRCSKGTGYKKNWNPCFLSLSLSLSISLSLSLYLSLSISLSHNPSHTINFYFSHRIIKAAFCNVSFSVSKMTSCTADIRISIALLLFLFPGAIQHGSTDQIRMGSNPASGHLFLRHESLLHQCVRGKHDDSLAGSCVDW